MKCFFCGINNVYDHDLNQVILARLNVLAELEPELEFFFCRKYGNPFFDTCFHAVRELKALRPGYPVTVTFVLNSENLPQNRFMEQNIKYFDRIIRLPEASSARDYMFERVIMKSCDCVLTYTYPQLYDNYNYNVRWLKRYRHIRVIDLTSAETTRYLTEQIYPLLTERERFALLQHQNGVSLSEIGAELKLTSSGARQVCVYATKKMKKWLWVYQKSAESGASE